MLSIDTSILFHACNADSPSHARAFRWLTSLQRTDEVAISELVLAELYGLLRNPAVVTKPLGADDAVDVIQAYRNHPRWRLVGFTAESRPLHDALWTRARAKTFAFRRLYDTRTALTLTAHGVTELATVNVKDFDGLGFSKVWNPLA